MLFLLTAVIGICGYKPNDIEFYDNLTSLFTNSVENKKIFDEIVSQGDRNIQDLTNFILNAETPIKKFVIKDIISILGEIGGDEAETFLLNY